VHLDLKPANFLIVAGTIKLIDFGIASKVDRDKTHVTKDNQLGTLNFMSPESLQVINFVVPLFIINDLLRFLFPVGPRHSA